MLGRRNEASDLNSHGEWLDENDRTHTEEFIVIIAPLLKGVYTEAPQLQTWRGLHLPTRSS